MFTSVNTRAASAYKRVSVDTGVQSADPHQLVNMLYEALLLSLQQARERLAAAFLLASLGDQLTKGGGVHDSSYISGHGREH